MRVGLTCDLRDEYLAAGYGLEETAEFDRADTVDALENALRALGHAPDRIGHVRTLVSRLAAGERWDMVFNIAEGLRGYGREAQVPALLEAYGIPYTFSDPLVLSLSLHKGMTKRVIREFGIPTPEFLEVRSENDCVPPGFPFPVFVKPVSEGTGKGIGPDSKVEGPEELLSRCRVLLSRFEQPVLVEEFLPGREFTVGILGTGENARPVGTLEVVLLEDAEPNAYSYENKEKCEELVRYVLVDDPESRHAEHLALAAWQALGCRDAGRVDLRSDANGMPQFLEVNPLAGLHPEHSDLPILCTLRGIPYEELIRQIVDSAASRIPGFGSPAGPEPPYRFRAPSSDATRHAAHAEKVNS